MPRPANNLDAAYDFCLKLASSHYENFPVASVLIPKRQRGAIAAIYAFSRIADDFADEDCYEGVRLEKLDEWGRFLQQENPEHPVFVALKDTRKNFDLPPALFTDLLTAFRLDVTKKRHPDFASVLEYCSYSANPVGRLVLHLFGQATPDNLVRSDSICTALQLTNFWQDIAIDNKKNRIYIPLCDLAEFGLSEEDVLHEKLSPHFVACMEKQFMRTRQLFISGKDLCTLVPGRLGMELRLTWLTGSRILCKTRDVGFDVFSRRPKLGKKDFFRLMPASISKNIFKRVKI